MAEPRAFDLVVIAASAGGIRALQTLLSKLPPDFPVPICVVQHRTSRSPDLLPGVLGRHTRLRVKPADPGEPMRGGTVYLAPADLHLIVNPDHTLDFMNGRKIRFVLSSANPLFASAARATGTRTIGVVLTGSLADATDGVQAIKNEGGVVIAQDRETSEHFGMPGSAIASGAVDYVLPLEHISRALVNLVAGRGVQPDSQIV